MDSVKFYGFDILRYYWYAYQNNYIEYSWQIKIAYSIVVLSIILLFVMTIYFFIKYKQTQKTKKIQKEVNKLYKRDITEILLKPNDEYQLIYNKFGNVNKDYHSKYFIPILMDIRMQHPEQLYLKNMQNFANVLGIRDYLEHNLLTKKKIFDSLQCLVMLQITITEGRLANYVNHKDKNIRTYARIAYIYCSTNEPYKFLFTELNEKQSSLKTMLLHYVFSWMHIQGKKMPNFIQYTKDLENDVTSAFMLNESKYYEKSLSKNDLMQFYHIHKEKTKNIAILLSKSLEYEDIVDTLLNIYPEQSETIKKSIIKTLANTGKEKAIPVLKELYMKSVSKVTKETILISLTKIDGGINIFKQLEDISEDDKQIFNRIEALVALEALKELKQNDLI